MLLVLTANRGLCGGYNSQRAAGRLRPLSPSCKAQVPELSLEVSGKRGISAAKFRSIPVDRDVHAFRGQAAASSEVEVLANRYLEDYAAGKLDRLDVAYMRFENVSRQSVAVETLLPLGALGRLADAGGEHGQSQYEFLPSAESILEEVVPTSFKVKLFKCFLDAAVSEQIARMVAMKAATEERRRA